MAKAKTPPIQNVKRKRPPKLKSKPTGPTSKWDDSYYVQFDRLLGQGSTVEEACEALGVNYHTFNEWLRSMPALKRIVNEHRKRGNGTVKGKPVANFVEFVYGRLTPELQDYWDQINEHFRNPSAGGKVEAILQNAGEHAWQRLFVHAAVACCFNMSLAMQRCMVSKKRLDRWKADPCFNDLLEELQFHQACFCEGALMELVASGNPQTVMFSNRALNPQKYNPTKHVNLTKGKDENAVDLSLLSMETRLQILKELRAARQAHPQPIADDQAAAMVNTVVIPPNETNTEETDDE